MIDGLIAEASIRLRRRSEASGDAPADGGISGVGATAAETAVSGDAVLDSGFQVVRARALAARPFDPGWPLIVLPEARAAAVADVAPDAAATPEGFRPSVLPGRGSRTGPAALLRALYPADHPVLGLDGAADLVVGDVTDADLEGGTHVIPQLDPGSNVGSPHSLPWIVARLRAPDGCPWDREQTHESLRPFLLEEAHEVYEALERGATKDLAGELGDLLLQIVLHAEHAAEAGVFDLVDVYRSIGSKIVRRHPHVFGDVQADSVGAVLRNWEAIKAEERAEALTPAIDAAERVGTPAPGTGEPVEAPARPAAFTGLARSLPALAYSQEMQERAAALGYDWPDVEGVIDKLEEEAVELLGAETEAERREEFGDLLLVLVNLGRKLGIDAESALRSANAKFARRFALVERYAAERGRPLDAMTFEELDELWNRAKAIERTDDTSVAAPSRRDPEEQR